MGNNTELWDKLGKTDPAHTKGFSRAGGFKGTSVKPMWVSRRLTEEFGPAGIGWGVNKPEFQVVHGDGEILVYCTVSAWYGDKGDMLWGVGGDKVVTKRSSGSFHDDEAFKKAFTDAVGNAFKSLGVAADIHMGLFDDDKYVAQMEQEFAPKAELITDEQRDLIQQTAEAAGVTLQRICKGAEIDNLKQLPASKYDAVMKKLNLAIEKMKEGNE